MRMRVTPKRTRMIAIAGGVLLIAGFFAYQLTPVFRAPRLTLVEPQRNIVVLHPRLTLRGAVDGEARLTVNHEEVYVGEDGIFTQRAYLALGTNTFTVIAQGKFGRRAELTRYVTYQQQ